MLSIRAPDAGIRDSTELQAAFALFTQVSTELTDSYRLLERRVEELSSELQQVDRARLQELEEKERVSERLGSLLNLLPAGVVVLDRNGRVCECNPAARDMLGEELHGQRWVEVIRSAFAPRLDDGHEISLASGRRVSVETRSLDRDFGQVVLLTDQTETRELQDRLSRNQRLTAMGRMMAALAHQIRTPLSAAMLYASNLRDAELTPAQARKFSARILERLTHMERQVRDMLIFVRGDVRPAEIVSAGELLGSLASAMDAPLAAAAAQCDTRVECNPGLSLRLNRDALVGAVLNLVNNALQAAGHGARIMLRLAATDGQLEISVIDRGPGMNGTVLAQLGEDFFTTKAQGTGLGIAVVRSVAIAHGGDISIRSAPGEGTCASIRIPVLAEGFESGAANHA